MKPPYDVIVWDFNGTLLDDVEAGIRSANLLLSRRSLPLIESVAHYHAVFGFPIRSYYQRLGFDFDKEPYEVLAVEWVNEYLINAENAPLCPGAKELLTRFRDAGIPQVVLSMTEREMLLGQIDRLGIASFFDAVYGLDNIHAASKLALAGILRKDYPDQKLLLIGDTDHDAESASVIGADCALVAIGHQSRETLCRKAAESDGSVTVFDSHGTLSNALFSHT